MRVSSFDIFDTVITRSVAAPGDLFIWCGLELQRKGWSSINPIEFARYRIQAEKDAKKKVPHREVGIEDIYAMLTTELAWDTQRQHQAMTIELELEARVLHQVPSMHDKVKAARAAFDRIIFISDMYLPESFLQSILAREGLHQPGDLLYVSGERKCSKTTGKLFEQIRNDLPGITRWEHTGDNLHSDVLTPRSLGIEAIEFHHTKLNRYEILARGNERSAPLWRSHLAGAMRLARLHCPLTAGAEQAVIWNTGSNVVGPLLYGFVQWCLITAAQQGIQRLYFVARDGQILLRIARLICASQNLPIDCRYLHGSRQAWRPAAIGQISEKDLEWIAPKGHRLTIINVFSRAAATPDDFEAELAGAGFSKAGWSRELSEQQLDALGKLLLRPDVATRLEARTSHRRKLLVQYLAQSNVFDGVPNALVDIGWFGNLQRCLGRAVSLEKGARHFNPVGFYFGLFPNATQGEPLLMRDYWSQLWTLGHEIENQNITLFECFTAADHGSVVEYQQRGEIVEPVLQEPRNESALAWGLNYLQGGIMEFCEHFARHNPPATTGAGTAYQRVARQIWNEFQIHPSGAEANVWGKLQFTDQRIEQFHLSLAPKLTNQELRESIKDYTKRPTGWWAEGTFVLTQNPMLRRFLRARRAKQALKSAAKRLLKWIRA